MVKKILQELENGSQYVLDRYDNVLLVSDDSSKIIGKIKYGWLSGKRIGFFLKNEKESSRLRKLDAWTIPVPILDEVDYVYYQTEKDIYKISSFNAFQYGVFRTFGGEEKLCVPVRFWEQKSEMED